MHVRGDRAGDGAPDELGERKGAIALNHPTTIKTLRYPDHDHAVAVIVTDTTNMTTPDGSSAF
jgi:hypothetical protein